MSRLGLYREVYSLELRRRMAYRSEFWFSFVGVLGANVLVAYYLWSAVFGSQGVTSIEGYTLSGMVLYYLLVPMIEGMARSHEAGFLAGEVYEGTLTRFFVYPMSFFPYQFALGLAGVTIAAIQMALVLGFYAMFNEFPAEMTITWSGFFLGVLTAVLACVLNFVMVSLIEMTSFWAENIWSLNLMLVFATRIFGGALLPLALFPDAAQRLLFLTPFPYLVAFPIQALTGKLDSFAWCRGVLIMLVWTLIFIWIGKLVWRRGNLQYTGVGI